MASEEENDLFDIYNFELQLREKINELQWKNESLEETQKELLETSRRLHETQIELEDERRSSNQLQMQLKTALETVKYLEQDNTNNQGLHIQAKMKYEAASIERDVLIEQARKSRLENMDLKVKIQEFERNLKSFKMANENLEASLLELKNTATRLEKKIQNNIGKLEREQEELKKSCEISMKFGHRVQTILKNFHVTHQRDKKLIEELKKRITSPNIAEEKSIPDARVSEQGDIGSLRLKMESTLKELRLKIESNSIDEKLSVICSELQKINPSSTKN